MIDDFFLVKCRFFESDCIFFLFVLPFFRKKCIKGKIKQKVGSKTTFLFD